MDEYDLEEYSRRNASGLRPGSSVDAKSNDVADRIRMALARSAHSPDSSALDPTHDEQHGQRPGITWVRASDLLNAGSGRIAGRSFDLETELARRLRRAPATTRRAIRERAAKLPPLSEFGRSPEHAHFSRPGMGRR
ncbi:hypothetical protein GE115_02735 [Agromyces sp. CFH 90414]|uniref:Uncharacterized protein n=1 Tax=Agromyces agglutinans TaxID=2662258 RepID=A0A6I2F9V8_9MICO|nr:hypothetical protein [Agromyces agglutinans]MRG58793.1 hypothetical protein [Agromyces agglutinans]